MKITDIYLSDILQSDWLRALTQGSKWGDLPFFRSAQPIRFQLDQFTIVPFSQFQTHKNKTHNKKTPGNCNKNIWLWIEWNCSTNSSGKSDTESNSTTRLIINNPMCPCCSFEYLLVFIDNNWKKKKTNYCSWCIMILLLHCCVLFHHISF